MLGSEKASEAISRGTLTSIWPVSGDMMIGMFGARFEGGTSSILTTLLAVLLIPPEVKTAEMVTAVSFVTSEAASTPLLLMLA